MQVWDRTATCLNEKAGEVTTGCGRRGVDDDVCDAHLMHAMQALDVNQDGKISRTEFTRAMTKVSHDLSLNG